MIFIAAMTTKLPLSQTLRSADQTLLNARRTLQALSQTDGGATSCHTITADVKHYQHSMQYLNF
jgi:uncharacterized protein YoxC